ncbi:MAG: aminotransferase class I/II-fold pyridoxal phosphate-dependent enzyme [Candidatus Nealsonbacteria bacterium]|nr:aminotransferase class I/II-fold pyridoxal phosphate-dependent enzyme [Candidatus Nealsonbacteria bacterium]
MPLMGSPPGDHTVIDGTRYLYFAGTGYLGLQGHPDVIRAACEAAQRYGISSANSRTAFGNTAAVLEVERRAGALFGGGDAFYFASGYMGPSILLQTLQREFDAVLLDEWSHYCSADAARQTGLPVVAFRHADPDDLHARLTATLEPGQRPLVLTDGVFAARGEIAPLAELWHVLDQYPGAILCVDDAHGLGVLGADGRGTIEHAGLTESLVRGEPADANAPRLFLCGTLSKAVGGYGGILPSSRDFIARVKATAGHYGGATPPPTPVAAATAKALELLQSQPALRTRLRENAMRLKQGLREMGFSTDDTPVPICCLTVGDAANMRRIQQMLMEQGIAIAYMAAYSGLGPEGALRVAVFATHTDEMIRQLLDSLRLLV